MRTLLVTGFGPFPGAPHNPSAEIVALLRRDFRARFLRAGIVLKTHILPVAYTIGPRLDALVARVKPDAIVHLGVAGSRRRVSVETRARNRASTIKPDALGRYARASTLAKAAAVRTGVWNAARLVAALHARRIDAALSNDAGDYICNATFWRSLEMNAAPSIFIHVPKKRRLAPARLAAALASVLPSAMPVVASRGRTPAQLEQQ